MQFPITVTPKGSVKMTRIDYNQINQITPYPDGCELIFKNGQRLNIENQWCFERVVTDKQGRKTAVYPSIESILDKANYN